MFFYICANTDPRQDQLLPKKPFGLLEMLSLLLHIAIKIRILVYKTKVGQPSLVSSCFLSLKKSTVAPNFDKHSIANFSTNIFNVIIFSVVVVVISKVNSLSPPQINDYPNYLYVYIHQFVYPNVIGFVTSGVYYVHNPSLRKMIINELSLIYNLI